MLKISIVAFIGTLVSADFSSLTSLLQQKIQQQAGSSAGLEVSAGVEAIDCSHVMRDFCPVLTPTPNVNFSSSGGSVVGKSNACCKGNYLQCQFQLRTPLYRDLSYYAIPSTTGNMEDKCPPTTAECTCQQALAAETYLRLNFCPSPKECCPTCECHGDPHCSPFDRLLKSKVWAVCDDRDASCTHQSTTCALTTYNGVQCTWVNHGGGYGECVRATGTPDPIMQMYTKTYLNYFNPSDPTVYTFKITLGLTTYGSIGTITLEDAGVVNVFSINSAGKCVASASYPLNNQNQVQISGLPSGVEILLTCQNNGVSRPQRWDVTSVKDPWFVPSQVLGSPDQTFGGFCTTGVIAENTQETVGGCSIMDRQLALYYGCSPNTPIANCKAKFCQSRATQLVFPGLTGTPLKQCTAFVNDLASPNNFLYAACALAKMGSPAAPVNCLNNPDCKQCVDDVMDYPEQIATVLGTAPVLPTNAPTGSCPSDLLSVGLTKKKLSSAASGIQIEYFSSGTWNSIFALTDEEIIACGGCTNTLFVNGSVAANQVLLTPGSYRVRQQTGFDSDTQQPLCNSAPGYNSTVVYSNPMSGGAVSASYGVLFDSGDLVCSATKFPRCPLNYQCCVWDKATQLGAWTLCMNDFHGGASRYPQCGN